MSTTSANAAILAGRILLSIIFILSGFGKITGYAATAGYMESKGIPGALLPLVIATELGGGLLILAGFQTRIVAILLAGFTLVAAAIFHYPFTDMEQTINFMKNLAIAGGFLAQFAQGPRPYSADAAMTRTA